MTVLDRLLALEQFGIKLGLDNITTITNALSRPQDAWPAVHIAGTNGKGSVTAMVERGLRAAGHRTGRYTSPHLAHIEERVAINGVPIDSQIFETTTAQVLDLVDGLRATGALSAMPTFFEATTAVAFEIFRRQQIDVAVVEVGLGGRFDATNVLMPKVTAITSIALDHERHLGRSLAAIAFEKAGIVKPGVPLVLGEVPDEARAVIEQTCRERAAPVVPAGLSAGRSTSIDRGRATISIETDRRRYDNVRLALAGAHQMANAVVAVRVMECCDDVGVRVQANAIVKGLADVEWPARLEWLQMPNGVVLLDAAHNPAGAEALAAYLESVGSSRLPFVLAVMKDKDVQGILRPLGRVAAGFVATEVASKRSLSAEVLAAEMRRAAPDLPVTACPTPLDAVRGALNDERRVVVAGSIFLVGPLRAQLLQSGGSPMN